MGSLNKVQIIGFLGADPELKYTSSGRAICNLRVATTEKWKDKGTGQMKEKTDWHRITIWGETGENASKYLAKGSMVYVEGKLETRTYDKDGQKHYATDVIAHTVTFLDRKGAGPGQGERSSGAPAQKRQPGPKRDEDGFDQSQPSGPYPSGISDDDIPF